MIFIPMVILHHGWLPLFKMIKFNTLQLIYCAFTVRKKWKFRWFFIKPFWRLAPYSEEKIKLKAKSPEAYKSQFKVNILRFVSLKKIYHLFFCPKMTNICNDRKTYRILVEECVRHNAMIVCVCVCVYVYMYVCMYVCYIKLTAMRNPVCPRPWPISCLFCMTHRYLDVEQNITEHIIRFKKNFALRNLKETF